MERKSIILLATSDINYDQRLLKIAQSLQEFGADVLLIGRSLETSVALSENIFQQKRVKCFFKKGMLFYLEINWRFFLLLMRSKFNYVCANDADTLLGAWLASFFKSFKLVYDSHELFAEVPELQNKSFKKRTWLLIEKLGIRRSSKCYTVNKSLAEILNKQYHVHFDIVRNVPILKKEPKPILNEKFILYQGALNAGRGLETLIDAMHGIDCKLKIAGKGDLENTLMHKVNKAGLNDKIEFLGNLKPEDLQKVTHEAFIGVNLLADSSLNYYFSLANKFFDYIHAEIPQVSMAFPEYLALNKQHETAVLITGLNANLIAESIHDLINNNSKYNLLKRNCVEAKLHWNWQQESQVLKQIYAL